MSELHETRAARCFIGSLPARRRKAIFQFCTRSTVRIRVLALYRVMVDG